jgi:hypothetical protein
MDRQRLANRSWPAISAGKSTRKHGVASLNLLNVQSYYKFVEVWLPVFKWIGTTTADPENLCGMQAM